MNFDQRPLELYGHFVRSENIENLQTLLQGQHCPFLNRRCVKIRKSDPNQTIGACTVGYKGDPLVICPHRFLERDQVFLDAVYLLKPGLQYRIVPEVSMPGGSIDYFLVGIRGNSVEDYLGIELQSLDTTGTGGIWSAREDYEKGKIERAYSYGINWKMTAKTILVQIHHKIRAFDALGKKLVLVIQESFFNYMKKNFDMDPLGAARTHDPFHIHTYNLVQLDCELRLVVANRYSTDVRGVERMLDSKGQAIVDEKEVIRRILAKMESSRPLNLTH